MSWSEGPLADAGLGDFAFPVPAGAFEQLFAAGGEVPYAYLLYWLQLYSAVSPDDWKSLEQAMAALADEIAEDNDRTSHDVGGDQAWWLTLGPVDLAARIVTVQRRDELICALQPDADGALVAAVFRPLDARSAALLIGAAQMPGPDGRVCLRENNWEYLLDQTAGMGQVYAADRGDAYLSFWDHGLGIRADGQVDQCWFAGCALVPLRPAMAAVQLGVYYTLDETDGV